MVPTREKTETMMIAKLTKPSITLMLLLSLALPACGRSISPREREALMRSASSSTLEADSMRFSISTTMPGLGDVSGEGYWDLKQGSMSQVITFPVPGLDQPLRMEQLVIGGQTMYMKADGLTEGLPKGKSWVKLDLSSVSEELGFDFAALMKAAGATDPRGPLGFLKDAKGEIEELGREKVRGVDTTFYQLTIDVERSLQHLPADQAGAIKSLYDQANATEVPLEVWIDEDGLVRRMVSLTPVPENPSVSLPGGRLIETTMEFFDFGAKDQIQEPAPNEVADLGALL